MKENMHKYISYMFIGLIILSILYFVPYGVYDRANAFTTWMNNGTPAETVRYMNCVKKTSNSKDPMPLCKAIISEYELY